MLLACADVRVYFLQAAFAWLLRRSVMAKRKQKSGEWSKDEVKVLKKMFRSTSKATALGLKKTKKYLKSIGRAK